MTTYISADDLAKLVRDPSKKPKVDYLIVDVRDEDYRGGHIKGSINVPAHEIQQKARSLAEEYKAVPLVVFHCALSQVRGPKSARIYRETVKEALVTAASSDPLFDQQVNVLRGGFNSWLYRFKDTEPDLITAYDATVPRDDF
ncbi:Cdc25 phosphatase Ibp1 [Coemansia sp. RSA 2703]|nr:Cdc25 phosphatase Ibp1 [Coemansia sp. RSA 2703]KAJ2379535.1 Cdc25 phosphatase Ibp1 [Coemansia sp. RSA 2607]KAJ2398442.1 Cdc25 phosphatase Ibp1 [Coemansia sp. RSA 2603]